MFAMEARRIVIVVLGALINALALNFFLIAANVYASGFTGVAQLISSISSDYLGVGIGTGILLMILNIPVFILGWFKVGKGFTIYSGISVIFSSIFLEIIPVISLSQDIILNAVFGGLLTGVGVGISLRTGASTGGMDIIAMVIARKKDKPIGNYFLMLNALIVVFAGIFYEPENALYTLLSLYVSTKVIDTIHTRHAKVTAMIITHKTKEMQQSIYEKMVRGITIIPAKGGYSNESKDILYLVITRYELYDLEQTIKEVDPNAFANILETSNIFGSFRRD